MPPIVSSYPLSRQQAKKERVRVMSTVGGKKRGGEEGGTVEGVENMEESGGGNRGFNKVEGKSCNKTETS